MVENVVVVELVLDRMIENVVLCIMVEDVPPLVDLFISYPVIAEPPLFDGAVQERLTCDEETVVAVRPVGGCGAVAVDVADAFTSIAASSQRSPLPLAVHLQMTWLGDAGVVE